MEGRRSDDSVLQSPSGTGLGARYWQAACDYAEALAEIAGWDCESDPIAIRDLARNTLARSVIRDGLAGEAGGEDFRAAIQDLERIEREHGGAPTEAQMHVKTRTGADRSEGVGEGTKR